jgi:hypothetical protein
MRRSGELVHDKLASAQMDGPCHSPLQLQRPPLAIATCTHGNTLHNTMINAVLVFNNAGQPRLTKFYTQLETAVQQRLISEIFTLVANRPNSACNFLP